MHEALLIVAFLTAPVSVIAGCLTGAWVATRARTGQPIIPRLNFPKGTTKKKDDAAPAKKRELPSVEM